MKRKLLLIAAFCLVPCLALAASYTTYHHLTKPDRGDSGWHTRIDENFDTIDAALNTTSTALNAEIATRAAADADIYTYVLLKYGDLVARMGNLPEVYITTGTFNGPTGTVITLPTEVSAVSEYAVAVEATSRAGAIGDIYVTQGLDNATIHCVESNTTDTFKAIVIYSDDQNVYGTAINRKWYVSPLAGITDHCDNTTEGSLHWVSDQIGDYYATIELPGNHIYDITTSCSIPATHQLLFQNGAVLKPTAGDTVTFDRPEQLVAAPTQQIFDGDGAITFTNPGMVYVDWRGSPASAAVDMYADINATITSVPRLSTIVFGPHTYSMTGQLYIRKDLNFLGYPGQGTGATILKSSGITDKSILTYRPQPTSTISPGYMKGITFDGNNEVIAPLEFINAANYKVVGCRTDNAVTSGVEINGDEPYDWDNFTLSGISVFVWDLTFEDCFFGSGGLKGAYIHRNWEVDNSKVFGVIHFVNTSIETVTQVALDMVGGNDSMDSVGGDGHTTRGFAVTWTGGKIQDVENPSGNSIGVNAQNGVTLDVSMGHMELASSGKAVEYSLHNKSKVNMRSGRGLYDDVILEDNSTICDYTGTATALFHQKGTGQSPFCISDTPGDKLTFGSPNFPTSSSQSFSGYGAWKGVLSTDAYGNKWRQVESDATSTANYYTAVISGNNRYSPVEGRIKIPISYTDLNAGNALKYWNETDFVVTAVDFVVDEAFTDNETSGCTGGVGWINVGTTPHRDYYLSDTQTLASKLTAGAVIRAWDNDNATSSALRWSFATATSSVHEADNKTITSTSATTGTHKALFMPGHKVEMQTYSPGWEDNATYMNSYIAIYPCPYTGCLSCDGKWKSGSGYLVITGYPLEY